MMNTHTFIVAELSANHNQDIELAFQTMLAAKEAGADAVKIQTYTPDTITIDCDAPCFMTSEEGLWAGQTLYSLYQKAYTPYEWHPRLYQFAREHDILLFSTPFDDSAVDLLASLDNPIYKIASFEIVDLNLIRYAAKQKKPMILSIGIATEDEIFEAVMTCREVGNNDITLLQCTSEYPALPESAQLKMIPDLQERFHVKAGLSDHTLGIAAAVAGVAIGACVVEKHFILDRKLGGPDAAFSIEPAELKELAAKIRETEKMLGLVDYSLTPAKTAARHSARSLFAVKDIPKGGTLTRDNVRSIRPYDGLAPKHLDKVLGRIAKDAIRFGTPLSWDLLE